MARGKETELTNAFKKTFKSLGAFAYKIPDDASPGFKLPRPFDMIAVFEGTPVAIEFKWAKEPASINQKTLRENQHAGLKDFEASGGLALVGLFVKVGRGDIRLLFWRYSDFVARGRVLAKEQRSESYIEYNGKEKRFEILQTKQKLLDLINGFDFSSNLN